MAELALENNESTWRRELNQDRRERLADKAAGISDTVEKVRDIKKAYSILKTVKIAFGATLVLAIVTYLIQLAQYIFANLAGMFFIPKLEGAEVYLFYMVSAVVILVILFVIVVIMALLDNPVTQVILNII